MKIKPRPLYTKYDWKDPLNTLEIIKERILDAMWIEERWYAKSRELHSFLSRLVRSIAIVLFGFGILWPIISAKMTSTSSVLNIDWGYIGLAVGGLLLLLDKYLGISTSYVRFYIAEMDIKKNTHEFVENWDIESAKAANGSLTLDNILALLNTVKAFRQSVFNIIQVETGAWAVEFQTQAGELSELFKQKQNEYKKPTDISVVVENHDEYADIKLGIDDEALVELGNNSSIIFRNVSIQVHTIKIQATKKDGSTVGFSKNVDVTGEKTVEVTLTLPK
jgi:hypothetical protein